MSVVNCSLAEIAMVNVVSRPRPVLLQPPFAPTLRTVCPNARDAYRVLSLSSVLLGSALLVAGIGTTLSMGFPGTGRLRVSHPSPKPNFVSGPSNVSTKEARSCGACVGAEGVVVTAVVCGGR